MSALIIFHFNLQSFSTLLKMDLRLKLEFNYRILLKKYSWIRVSICNMGFSWDLEFGKEDKLWKQGEICFSYQIPDIVFRRQWILKKAKHVYFCPITRAVTFWHSFWTLPLSCSWYKVKEYLVITWSKVLQLTSMVMRKSNSHCGVPFGTDLWRCNLDNFLRTGMHKNYSYLSMYCQVLKSRIGR